MHIRKFCCTFVPKSGILKSTQTILLALLLLLSPMSWAEVVTLRTGQSVKGEILLQNEEVVIVRTQNGMRYQYPTSEVASIKTEEVAAQEAEVAAEKLNLRAVNMRFQVHSGAVYVPDIGWGGQIAADWLIGSRMIRGKRLFVGGGIGYRAKIMPADTTLSNTTYSFIPLQAMVSVPLLAHQHAPVIGISAGYGFAANKHTQGGICVGVDLGWNYFINKQSSFQLALYADWQQARTDVKQVVDGKEYVNHMGCNFISTGLKLSVLF